jgi:phosphate transport system substrate-binding protein
MRRVLVSATVAALTLSMANSPAMARDEIRIVGSSTVFPFAAVVAERFGRTSDFSTPVIESTGSGGGFRLFCSGLGENTPDITNSSRAIKSSEVELCASNGVTDIIEVNIGFDGIVLANANGAPNFELTTEEIFLALAKTVPVNGNLVPNPFTRWSEINSALPDQEIIVLGPPPTSGTRDAFVELVMEIGGEALGVEDDEFLQTMREDGRFIEAGENDNLIVQKLTADENTLGIFGFSFLDQNADKIKGNRVNGTAPSFETIADSSYAVSRPLFFYIKKAHLDVIPGLGDYVSEFISDNAAGDDGYLLDRGLIPLSGSARQAVIDNVGSFRATSF